MNKNNLISNFEKFEVWKKSRELRNDISKTVKSFPSIEKYRLADQLVRSSRSVTANIAEGSKRYHFQENIQFCRQARGSLYELLDHLSVALDEQYINIEIYNEYRSRVFEILKIMNGYIKYLKMRKDNPKSQ